MPTLAGFIQFVRNINITAVNLPDNSVWLVYAFNVAMAIVNTALCGVPVGPPENRVSIYTLAVYNLAASNLIEFAHDPQGLCFFEDLRKKWNMNSFVAGVISSSSDEGTSQSLTVPEAFETLTIADLQCLKNPYGRQYLALAQRFGTLWNLA